MKVDTVIFPDVVRASECVRDMFVRECVRDLPKVLGLSTDFRSICIEAIPSRNSHITECFACRIADEKYIY